MGAKNILHVAGQESQAHRAPLMCQGPLLVGWGTGTLAWFFLRASLPAGTLHTARQLDWMQALWEGPGH